MDILNLDWGKLNEGGYFATLNYSGEQVTKKDRYDINVSCQCRLSSPSPRATKGQQGDNSGDCKQVNASVGFWMNPVLPATPEPGDINSLRSHSPTRLCRCFFCPCHPGLWSLVEWGGSALLLVFTFPDAIPRRREGLSASSSVLLPRLAGWPSGQSFESSECFAFHSSLFF